MSGRIFVRDGGFSPGQPAKLHRNRQDHQNGGPIGDTYGGVNRFTGDRIYVYQSAGCLSINFFGCGPRPTRRLLRGHETWAGWFDLVRNHLLAGGSGKLLMLGGMHDTTIDVDDLDIGVRLLRLRRRKDGRGWFSELFQERWLAGAGIDGHFVQDNASWSEHRYTLRGMHAQRWPMAQAKLITVLTGSVFDAVVDCRERSATYGKSQSVILSADEPALLYIPRGFCHGFLSLQPATTVFYKVDNPYSPEHETGVRWDDPALGIDWPLDGNQPVMSKRDGSLPFFEEFRPLRA